MLNDIIERIVRYDSFLSYIYYIDRIAAIIVGAKSQACIIASLF